MTADQFTLTFSRAVGSLGFYPVGSAYNCWVRVGASSLCFFHTGILTLRELKRTTPHVVFQWEAEA